MPAEKMWKKDIVLNAIRQRDGMKYTEIQQLVVLMAGLDWEKRDETGHRQYRGYWCSVLGPLLEEHCTKDKDGKYRMKGVEHIARPTERLLSESLSVRDQYELERRKAVREGRLPPGPFDHVRIRISWSEEKRVSVIFRDSVKGSPPRELQMFVAWPIRDETLRNDGWPFDGTD